MASVLKDMMGQPTRPSKERIATYGNRPDGTPKGAGFFGEIAHKDNPRNFSTELGGEADVEGQPLSFPLLVPTLTRKEIDLLTNPKEAQKPANKSALDDIYDKAIDHALTRKKQGKSPYAEEGEYYPLPNE